MERVVPVAAPSYQLIIISSRFGAIPSVSLHLAALTVFSFSLAMFMDQMGQIFFPFGHGFYTLRWVGHREGRQKLFCNLAHGCHG